MMNRSTRFAAFVTLTLLSNLRYTVVMATKTPTISKADAATLFQNCGKSSTSSTLDVAVGSKWISVCPADKFSVNGNVYTFEKSGKTIIFTCGSVDCVISGSMVNAPTTTTTTTTTATDTTTPTYTVIVDATYEDGDDVTSGITGLTGTHAAASDAAYIADFGAGTSSKSICHKTLLDDDKYKSSGKSRSESDAIAIMDTRYKSGTEFIYKFSLLLKDWGDYSSGPAPIDIIWQFKHTQGGPDAMMGIKRNQLVLRYGEEKGQKALVNDVRKFDNQFIDIVAHVKWEDTPTGYLKIWVQTPDDTRLKEIVNLTNYKSFTNLGKGDFGYLKWGLYRPDSTLTNNHNERIACHDQVKIIKVT